MNIYLAKQNVSAPGQRVLVTSCQELCYLAVSLTGSNPFWDVFCADWTKCWGLSSKHLTTLPNAGL